MDEQALQDRRVALGELVEAASHGELILYLFLCALVGTKLGAVLVAGMTGGEMLTRAAQLVDAHDSIASATRIEMKEILDAYKRVNEARNRLVHDPWSGQGKQTVQIRTKRGTYYLSARPAASVGEIKAVVRDLEACWTRLLDLGFEALGTAAWGTGLEIRPS